MCVFGVSDFSQDPVFLDKGKEMRYSLGIYLRKLLVSYVLKNFKILRMNFPSLDSTYITSDEREALKNTHTLRAYIRDLINERKE